MRTTNESLIGKHKSISHCSRGHAEPRETGRVFKRDQSLRVISCISRDYSIFMVQVFRVFRFYLNSLSRHRYILHYNSVSNTNSIIILYNSYYLSHMHIRGTTFRETLGKTT